MVFITPSHIHIKTVSIKCYLKSRSLSNFRPQLSDTSLIAVKFPDISRFSRHVVTLVLKCITVLDKLMTP